MYGLHLLMLTSKTSLAPAHNDTLDGRKNSALATRAPGYDWLWFDRRCIDKSFLRCQTPCSLVTGALVCLVYLSDIGDDDPYGSDSTFLNSRCGRSVVFLSHHWTRIGSSPDLAKPLEQITNIDAAILLSNHPGRDIAKQSLARHVLGHRPEHDAPRRQGVYAHRHL